jgi:hypothetical protein
VIALDRHAPPASVPELTSRQVSGEIFGGERKTGGDAVDDRDERLPVRFAGGQKTQHSRFILSEKIAALGRVRARRNARDRSRAAAIVLHSRFAPHDPSSVASRTTLAVVV